MDSKGIIPEAMLDDVIIDYLNDGAASSPPDPDGIMQAVITGARRAEFARGQDQKARIALDEREANDEELKQLNASSWVLIAELPRETRYTHLIRSGEELWAAFVLWL